jgi:hypothetical protein
MRTAIQFSPYYLLMTVRESLIEKLASTLHLNVSERAALGPEPISRAEVSAAVLRVFRASGQFPPHAYPWRPGRPVFEGHFLELLANGTARLWWQRHLATNPAQLAEQMHMDFSSPAEAVDEFITREWRQGHVDGVPFVR